MGSATCRGLDSNRLYISFSSVRADNIMNGYFGTLTHVALPTELLSQVIK